MTASGCVAYGQPDDDDDGLSNACEVQLATNFRPMLSFYAYDQIGRESRWFAQPTETGVRLGYLLGYYYDVGNLSAARGNCQTALVLPLISFLDWILGGGVSSCLGHLGDSEFIILDVAWNPTSHHWVLKDAWLSAHGNERHLASGPYSEYPQGLVYPEEEGGYPYIWVADGKHANYESEYECDTGAFLGADDCKSPRNDVRIDAPVNNGNIGSHFVHLIDAVTCINPNHPAIVFGPGCRTEYYFTDVPFQGWYPGSGATAGSYADVLEEWMPEYVAGPP